MNLLQDCYAACEQTECACRNKTENQNLTTAAAMGRFGWFRHHAMFLGAALHSSQTRNFLLNSASELFHMCSEETPDISILQS